MSVLSFHWTSFIVWKRRSKEGWETHNQSPEMGMWPESINDELPERFRWKTHWDWLLSLSISIPRPLPKPRPGFATGLLLAACSQITSPLSPCESHANRDKLSSKIVSVFSTYNLMRWHYLYCHSYPSPAVVSAFFSGILSLWGWSFTGLWVKTGAGGGGPQGLSHRSCFFLPSSIPPSFSQRAYPGPSIWLHVAGSVTLGWPPWGSVSPSSHGNRPIALELWLGVYKDDQAGWPHVHLFKEYLLMAGCTRWGKAK